ncbi:VaFE repeat-containing surface-anchored protein, partial [Corynebacterium tuberculostearicum]|uniref:VaFE repeat-containing surface-anchored protein n=1 Tax=Corynebacterium tuberculostearicum TaxID=38304 RepID=UPI0020275877
STAVDASGKDSESGDENKIAEHTDINDKAQTVDSHDELTPETSTSKSPDNPGNPGGGKGTTEQTPTTKSSEVCESEEPSGSKSVEPSEEPSESESSEPSESESVETTTSEASETTTSDKPKDCVTTTPKDETEKPETSTSKTSENPENPGGGKDTTEQSSTTESSEVCESEEPSGSESVEPSEEPSESESVEPSESESVETTTSEASETTTSDKPSDCVTTTPGKPDSNEEKKTPKITTNADFEKGSHEVVAGAKIVDEVSYEGLVPGKEYTLKAELISKKDGKTVLGTGEATFTPKKSKGMEPVTITVNDDVTEPVKAAVAFEELTSTEVDENGEDKPADSETPNEVADHKDINDKDQTVTSHKKGGKTPWWLILIPGIGLGKIIKDHFDHKDHGNHNGGHGDNNHQPGNQDAPEGGNSGHGNGNGDAPGQEPEEVGNALPSDAQRVDIKSVPSGATELEPGMQSYVK